MGFSFELDVLDVHNFTNLIGETKQIGPYQFNVYYMSNGAFHIVDDLEIKNVKMGETLPIDYELNEEQIIETNNWIEELILKYS